jgi:hypothetical protein
LSGFLIREGAGLDGIVFAGLDLSFDGMGMSWKLHFAVGGRSLGWTGKMYEYVSLEKIKGLA